MYGMGCPSMGKWRRKCPRSCVPLSCAPTAQMSSIEFKAADYFQDVQTLTARQMSDGFLPFSNLL